MCPYTPLIIHTTFISCRVAACTPLYYNQYISFPLCCPIYTLLLCPCLYLHHIYIPHFHSAMLPRIITPCIHGTFPSCHVPAYTPSYYTRHFSILSCLRVYTLLLYAADCEYAMG